MKNLEILKLYNKNVIDDNYSEILKYCEDAYVKEFVELLTDFDTPISRELTSFLWELGYNVNDNTFSDCQSIHELYSFLSNINDDFYFSINQNDFGKFYAKGDDIEGLSNINDLIWAAKENIELYRVKEELHQERLKCLK